MCPRECFGEREDTWCYGLIETHGPFPPISPIAVIRSTSKRPRRMSKLTNDNGRLKMLAVPCTHLNFKPKWTTTWKTVPESHQYVNPQSMLFIDGDIHFVSRSTDTHFILKSNGDSEVNTIGIHAKSREILHGEGDIAEAVGGTAVYIPSKRVILVMGGIRKVCGDSERRIPVGEVFKGSQGDDGRWHWEEVAEGQPMESPHAVVTGDGRYIIVSSVERTMATDFVHVMDTENGFKWRRTGIVVPLCDRRTKRFDSAEIMFKTGSTYKTDVLVRGYVRGRCRVFPALKTLPAVLTNLIYEFHRSNEELIHWVSKQSHIAIAVRDILTFPSEDAMPNWMRIREHRRFLEFAPYLTL